MMTPSSARRTRFTSATTASGLSFARRLWTAAWTADNDDEQAVSTVMLGPRKSKKLETWAGSIERKLW